MALFNEKLTDEVVAIVNRRYAELAKALIKQSALQDHEGPISLRSDMDMPISVAYVEVIRPAVFMAGIEPAQNRCPNRLLGYAMQ